MSRILELLIEQQVRPRTIKYSAEKKAIAVKNLAPLIAAAGGTARPPSGLGTEFDELLYDILIPSIAAAVQQYITTSVTTNPGQPVTVVGPTGAMIGSTSGPGTVIAR